MRVRLAFATIAILASAPAANAADGPAGLGTGGYGNYSSFGGMEPVIVYDYEPGVIVRSYWAPPWDNRHYFPKTGRRPKVGRLEHMPPRRNAINESYYRYWSVSSFFIPGPPREIIPVPSREIIAGPPRQVIPGPSREIIPGSPRQVPAFPREPQPQGSPEGVPGP